MPAAKLANLFSGRQETSFVSSLESSFGSSFGSSFSNHRYGKTQTRNSSRLSLREVIKQMSQRALQMGSSFKIKEANDLCPKVPSLFKRDGLDYYILRVSGDAVTLASGSAPDLVLVKRTETAQDEDVIVCAIDGVVSIKKYKILNGQVELHPARSNDQPILLHRETDFRVAGVVERMFQL